jgi:uncharacterized phage-associated protein
MGNSRTVAKSMFENADELGLSITNLKLHKLLYLAHGLALAKFDRPLLTGEQFAAWKYGPVMESLYHDLKVFGSSAIKSDSPFVSSWPSLDKGSQDEMVIQSILKQFGKKSAGTLIDITHKTDGPWHEVFDAATTSISIDDEKIKAYFKKHLKKND